MPVHAAASRSLRHRLPAAALLLLVAAAPLGAAVPVDDVDRIAAVVNDEVITETELSMRLAETKKQLALEKIKAPTDAILKRQVLERMIMERVQLQLAAKSGIRVGDEDVEQALRNIARRNKTTPENFIKTLARRGLDPAAFRNQVHDQLSIQQLVEREINNRVTVTEAEITGFLEDQENRARVSLEYNIAHIFIAIPESAAPETIQASKQRADDILRQLRQGGDFGQAAISHSTGAEALKGGGLGWKKAGQLPELFLAALGKMRKGEVSDVLRGPNGFHIIKLNDKRGETAAAAAVTQTHARHILLRPSEILGTEEARKKLLQLRGRIENGEDFAALARAHSEDTASAAEGGDLGWISPGQTVPDFEKAMSALKPDQLSAPVPTSFGLHLIQVLGRRSQDISQERNRAAARSQIHARKADERYEQWLRQLRDEAYVEYMENE